MINKGGGLLHIWHSSFIQDEVVIKGDRWICVKRIIKEGGFECAIGLVYRLMRGWRKEEYGVNCWKLKILWMSQRC